MNSFNSDNFSDNTNFRNQDSNNDNFNNNGFRRKDFNNKSFNGSYDDDKKNNETIIDELINSLFPQEYNLKQNLKQKNQQQEDMYSNKKIEYEIIMDCSNKSDYIIYYFVTKKIMYILPTKQAQDIAIHGNWKTGRAFDKLVKNGKKVVKTSVGALIPVDKMLKLVNFTNSKFEKYIEL